MSFFLKKSRPLNGVAKNPGDKRKKRKFDKKPSKNEEITSSEEEDAVDVPDHESSEDENETAQEKKLRLAKIYLKEIEKEEKSRLEDGEVSKEALSKRLRDDYLKETGRYELKIADQYSGPVNSTVKYLKCKEQYNTITCLCVCSDDEWMFSGSKNGVLVKWSLTEQKKLGVIPFVKTNTTTPVLGHTSCIYSLAISTDKKYLVVGDASGNIEIWNPETLAHLNTLKGHRKAVTGLCFKQGSHTLYSCSFDKSVRVWSLDEMAFVENLFGHQDCINGIDVLHSDRPVTAGGKDGTVRLWKVSEESQLIFNALPGHVDTVKMCNEKHFVSGGDDGALSVWSCLKKKPVFTVSAAHGNNPTNSLPYWISAVTVLPHSDLLASGSQDGSVRVWKLGEKFRDISLLFQIPVAGFINALSFTSDGKYLIVGCGKDHRLGRWDVVKSAQNVVVVIPLQRQE